MLRKKEEKERFEQEVKDLQENPNTVVDKKLLKKYRLDKTVRFEFDKSDEEEKVEEIDLDVNRFNVKTLDDWKYNIKKIDNSSDVNRSSWWKEMSDKESTAKKIINWIKINDIRYGIEEEKAKQKRQNFFRSQLGDDKSREIQIPDH